MVCGLRSGGNTRSVDYPWTALLANAIRSPAGDGAKGAAPNPFACQETRTEIVARRNREEILENAASGRSAKCDSGFLSFSRTHAAPVALRHSIWPDIALSLCLRISRPRPKGQIRRAAQSKLLCMENQRGEAFSVFSLF